jgi:hypothetical protein
MHRRFRPWRRYRPWRHRRGLRKQCMLDRAPYYEDIFRERFINIEIETATKQPTKQTIAKMRTNLGYVLLPPCVISSHL